MLILSNRSDSIASGFDGNDAGLDGNGAGFGEGKPRGFHEFYKPGVSGKNNLYSGVA